MGMASAGVKQAVDMADDVTDKAIEAVAELEDVAVSAGYRAIKVGDMAFDELVEEVRATKSKLLESLRKLSEAVTERLP